ncbi:MAG: PIN domain-containing protein [Limnochordia bacterium]|jgi:hypothetical protein
MRIMLDTNVLISIIVFRSQSLTDMMALVLTEHRLVLSSYVIEEVKQVVARGLMKRRQHERYFYRLGPMSLCTRQCWRIKSLFRYEIQLTTLCFTVPSWRM